MRPTDEQQDRLARLLDSVRADLRDWTDAPGHDPGIALLELLAYLGDALSSYADIVGAESFLGRRPSDTELRVTVDGEPWHRVTTLDASGPDDPHFVASRADDGATLIEFGDGTHGRRPPAGGEMRVSYRSGQRYRSIALQQGRVVLDAGWSPSDDSGTQSKKA